MSNSTPTSKDKQDILDDIALNTTRITGALEALKMLPESVADFQTNNAQSAIFHTMCGLIEGQLADIDAQVSTLWHKEKLA